MQKGNSTGKLPVGKNVNKFKNFYERLSSSNLKTFSEVSKPENMNGKPDLKPVKPDEPDLKLVKLDNKTAKPDQTGSNNSKIPPKPVVPPKPINLVKKGEKIRSNSQDSNPPPEVPPKPSKSREGSALSNKTEECNEECNGEQEHGRNGFEAEQNGFHNGIVVIIVILEN